MAAETEPDTQGTGVEAAPRTEPDLLDEAGRGGGHHGAGNLCC